MSDDEQRYEYEISEGDIVEINPAIDYHDGTAYIGMYLHCTKKNTKDQSEKETIEHFLIRSDRQVLHSREELPPGTVLSSVPMRIKFSRWARDDIKAWADKEIPPVNPVELYLQIRKKLDHYFEFSDETTQDIITLWGIGTYFFHRFPAYPYLFINGVKRTGKSKLLLFLKQITHNGLMSSSVTTASLHRAIESLRSTLLIDEHEFFSYKNKLSERQQELRAALLDGYRVGSEALKVEGDKTKTVNTYATYSPKALGNIAGLDDVLEDRCIYILMERALGYQRDTELSLEDPEWVDIRNKLHRFYLENASVVSAVSAVSVDIPEGINSRERLLWVPIFTMAKFFEGEGISGLTEKLSTYARKSSNIRQVEEGETNELTLIHALVKEVKETRWYSTSKIREAFVCQCDRDDPTDWVNNKFIGRLMKRVGLQEKRRLSRGMEYYITLDHVDTLRERYLLSSTLTTQTTLTTPNKEGSNLLTGKIFKLSPMSEVSPTVPGNIVSDDGGQKP